jgi:predicted Zn finger-like uncharacterized protein
MKIACQSCQAKYTIADEKVVGKVVKIRCKKCGSTIVVNGQDAGYGGQDGSAVEEPTEVRSSSADFNAGGNVSDAEGWTVNVADDDQRTLTTHQIVAEFAKGTISDETYCWRDGMGDWLPLREIEELSTACGLTAASAIGQPAPQARASAPAAVAAKGPSSVRPQTAGSGGGALAGIFGSSPPAAASGQANAGSLGGAAAARRAGGRAGGADLFGAAAEAGGENDVMTSAPQSGASAGGGTDDSKMTGQRNENSVLFSLNALTSSEPKKAGGGGSSGGLIGAAEGDGSGLIDIRALSSSMASSGGPKKANHADDIMNLGGGGAFSAALAAPVLTAPAMDASDPSSSSGGASNKKLYLMFGGLALFLVVGMVVMFFALQPKPGAPVAATDGTGTAAVPAAPGSAPAPTAAAPTASAPAAVAAVDPSTAAEPGGSKAAAPSVGVKHSSSNNGGNNAAARNDPPSVAPPPPPPPPTPHGNQSLESQMANSAGATGAKPAAEPTGGSSAPFDRGAASAALGAIADGVASCKKAGGPTGDGHVSITFSPGGNVVSAIVDQPPFAGTAVGGCVAGKFRGAHVPAFAGGNLTIGKRFSIN